MAYTSAQLVAAYTAANNGVAPDAATTALLNAFATQTQTGQLSDAAALSYVVNSAQDDVQVAVQAYQFFTGTIPSTAGLDYLTNSATNTQDLNDPYYAQFNLENRYINFAANLGVVGEGATAFSTTYGGLTFAQYVDVVYETIIGSSYAQTAGINVAAAKADIVARQANFVQIATDRGLISASSTAAQRDIAVKAAVAGYLMAEGVKADVGIYAAGANNYVQALVSGTAVDGVNLLTTYSVQGGGTGQAVGGTGPVAGGATLTLTANVDNIQGTSGDDTVIAGPGSAGGVHTLGASDVINGGAGTDKIIITSQAGLLGENLVPRMTSVEQVFVQAVGAGTTTVNMINTTGAQELWNDNSTGDVKITNLQEKATIGVKGGNGGNDYTVAAATAAARTGDLAIALDDANIDNLYVTKDGLAGSEGYASTTINAMGDNAIDTLAVGSKLATVKVTGEGSVAVEDNLAATVRTIDASANEGGVDFNITNNTGNTTFTGGAGDDRINFDATLDLNDKVDGGEGRDTLAVDNQNRIISNLQVSNVEVLELDTLNGTLNAALIAGVDEVRVVNTLSNARGTAVVNGLTSDSTFATADGGDVQLNIKNAQVAGTNDTLNLETAMGAGTLFVQAAGVETVNYTQTDVGVVNSTVSFYDTDGVVDMEKLTIANNKGNNVNFNDLVNTIKTVDASAAMGSVNISIVAGNKTNGVSITGGAGNDVLTGGDGKDIIVGGAGNDRIQGDANVGTPQITKVAVGTTDVGDTYTLSINGTVVTVEATAGNGNNVEGLLAAAINTNAIIFAQGITASAVSGDLLITGNPNGTAFTVANTGSTNAVARAEISTITLTSGADDGDTYRVTIGNTGTLADKNYNTAFAADATPAQARAAIITTLNADADFVAAGFTAALNGAGEIEVTGPVGNDFTLAINEQTPAAPTAQVDTITFGAGDLDAGDIFTVTIGSVSANYTMTGNAGVDGVGVQNAVNAALGTTVTAAFVDKGGGSTGLEANDQLTITADSAGTAFNATIKVNGAAAASTKTTTTLNDPVTSLAAAVTETQAALAAGANPNSPANLTVTQQQAPVLGGTAASDVLTGGEGKDTFVFIGQSGGWNGTSLTNMDTITDLDLGGAVANVGVDKIQLNAGFFNAAAINAGQFVATSLVNAGTALSMTGPTFEAGLQALFNAGGALNGATDKVGLFTYGADTYLIAADAVAGLGANDIVIKVTGVTGTLDLSDIVLA